MSSASSKKKDWYKTGQIDAQLVQAGKTGFILEETLQMLRVYDDPNVMARYLAGFNNVWHINEVANGNS